MSAATALVGFGGGLGAVVAVAAPASATPSTLYVSASGTVAEGGSTCAAPGYNTIAAALAAASSGDTIEVCAGTYDEADTISVADVTLVGAGSSAFTGGGSGVATLSGDANGFTVAASGDTIEGFTISGAAGYGVVLDAASDGATVADDAIEDNNDGGIYLSSTGSAQTTIEGDTIQDNGTENSGGADGIYANEQASDVLINLDTISVPTADSADSDDILFFGSGEQSNITVTNSLFSEATAVSLVDVSDATVGSNMITGTGAAGNDAIGLYGSDTDIAITGNTVEASTGAGVGISSYNSGVAAVVNSDVDVNDNSFNSADQGGGVALYDDAYYSGTLDAAGNSWGCATGPNTSGCATTTGAVTSSPYDSTAATATDSATATASTPATASVGMTSAEASGGAGTVSVASYPSNPAGPQSFDASGQYFDVSVPASNTLGSVLLNDCDLNGGSALYWFDSSTSTWDAVTGEADTAPTYTAGPPACLSVTLDTLSSPSLDQLSGTVFGVATVSGGGTPPTTTSAPSVSAISPATGSTAGGTTVTVTGANLAGATAVDFGSSAATDVTVSSAGTSLSALSPAEASGTVAVTVTTPEGTSPTSNSDLFTYAAPTVTPPASAPPSITASSRTGAGEVTISGDATPGSTVELHAEFFHASSFVPGASTVASADGTYGFSAYVRGTNHFYVTDNGQRSATVAAVVTEAPRPTTTDQLNAGGELTAGGELVNATSGERLVLQASDGNLVLYRGDKALWSAGTAGHAGDHLVLQASDGNLVIYSAAGQAIWEADSYPNPGDRLVLQGDGNLVIYSAAGKAVWATGTNR